EAARAARRRVPRAGRTVGQCRSRSAPRRARAQERGVDGGLASGAAVRLRCALDADSRTHAASGGACDSGGGVDLLHRAAAAAAAGSAVPKVGRDVRQRRRARCPPKDSERYFAARKSSSTRLKAAGCCQSEKWLPSGMNTSLARGISFAISRRCSGLMISSYSPSDTRVLAVDEG